MIIITALVAAVCGYALWSDVAASTGHAISRPERSPQTTWAACNRNADNGRTSTFTPLSDQRAAKLVTGQPEDRRYNARPYDIGSARYASINTYLPSAAALKRFRDSKTSAGQPLLQFNPYFRYVDGRDRLRNPSTDDLIQWAAHKWGIPENWLRAQYVRESYWNGFQLGDEASVSSRWYDRYPSQARITGQRAVFQSMGITQVKWIPDGSVGAGTEPLRWRSTAFNLDYQAATVRFYYDNPQGSRSSWGDSTYVPCQAWNSIGGWFEPYPWRNSGQEDYIRAVRLHLADRTWTTSKFVRWSPSSVPPRIAFK